MSESIYCTSCGKENDPTYAACTNCGTFLPKVAALPIAKPRKVQRLAVLILINGALNLLWGLLAALTLAGFNLYACVQTPFCLLLGGLEVIYAMKLLADPARPVAPARYLAYMQIINIISFNFLGLLLASPVVGILSLNYYSDPEVALYFESIRPVQHSKMGESVA